MKAESQVLIDLTIAAAYEFELQTAAPKDRYKVENKWLGGRRPHWKMLPVELHIEQKEGRDGEAVRGAVWRFMFPTA